MDDKTSDATNNIIKGFIGTAPILKTATDTYASPIANKCLEDVVAYNDWVKPRLATLKLIPNAVAKELHEAIALGGESVKRSLALWYTDPNILEVATVLVDTCVAFIGEEVTAILRKHSNI